MDKEFVDDIVKFIKKEKPGKQKLTKAKIKLCKKHKLKGIPNDIASSKTFLASFNPKFVSYVPLIFGSLIRPFQPIVVLGFSK